MLTQRSFILSMAVGAVVLALAIIEGPQLWGYWRFTQISAADQAQFTQEPVSSLAETCYMCHGDRGLSRSGVYPNLAGQEAAYLQRALDEMASGRRRAPLMAPLARALSAEQRQALAQWFAHQTPPPLDESLPQSVASCTACHGSKLEGNPAVQAPRLAGLGWTYVERQLAGFRGGARGAADGPMRSVAQGLESEALARLKHDWPPTDPLP